jgi:hypothetical protein
LLAVVVTATAVLVVVSGGSRGVAASTPQWWKTDLHDHSVISADAFPDLGIMAQSAKANGFNAIFLTDHNLGSNFAISGLTADTMTLDETLDTTTNYFRRWTPATFGSLSATTNAVSTADHYGSSGSHSLLLSSTSSTTGETFAWTKRGPNFRSETGPIHITFAVKPTRLDAGSSLYVSASIGGDTTVDSTPVGYTTASDNVAHPGKSTVLIWYLGAAPPASAFPNATVHEISLGSATPNIWKTYDIDARAAVAALPAAEQPLDYDALSDLKISAFANGGTATGFFDQYGVNATTAANAGQSLAADEFVYRNSQIGQYATSSFQFFPGVEEGENEHAQRFNFAITQASQYVNYPNNGIDGIPDTQATGYPAQLNHPGVSGGVTDSQATSTQAEGADLMEVRQQNMVDDWDTILRQNLPQTLIGTWGGDNHIGSWSAGSQATFIYAPSLDLDSLMHALFEGRAYVGASNFTSQMSFNLGTSATAPYPARYPVYVAAGTSQNVHLTISSSSGLKSGYAVIWKSNAGSSSTTSTIATDTSGTTYSATKSIPVSGAMTYVRAEVRKTAPSGTIVGLTEPIAFRTVAGLPSDLSMHVDSVTPASGCQCSLLQTKGIASPPNWNATSKTLTLALTNPVQATVELLGTSGTAPSSVSMDGTAVAASTSLSAFQSATGDAWYYDAASGALYLQDLQGTANSTVVVGFGGTTDSTPPSIPTGLTATGVSSSEVDLKWTASSDTGGSGLAGYNVFRGTQKLNGAPVTGTTFADTGLNASTAYTYTVTAVDNAGNQSDPSAPATGTTLAGSAGTGTFTAVADAYVDSSAASTNYGTRTTLRVDTSPTVRSYLRFTVSGLSGTVSSVQLKVHANTGLSAGFAVDALTDDTWKESTITYASAPAPGSQIAKSGAVTSGTDVTVTLPPSSVSGNGDVNLVLAGLSSTALSLGSRESATKPQLIVTTSAGGGGGDATPPSAPTGLKASGVSSSEIDLSWTASTDDSGVVAGYNVYEGTVKVNSTLVAGTSFNVTGLAAGSQHTYTVTAVDGSHNESANSGSATATTLQAGGGGGTFTFSPTADAYVDSSVPTTSYGTSAKLRVDGSPTVNSFLRFTLSGVTGTVTSVTLKVYATSSLAAGFAVDAVADNTWTEAITYDSEPTIGGLVANSSAATTGSYVTVTLPVTAVPASGDISFALTARSTTALALASRESTTPPQLVVTTS